MNLEGKVVVLIGDADVIGGLLGLGDGIGNTPLSPLSRGEVVASKHVDRSAGIDNVAEEVVKDYLQEKDDTENADNEKLVPVYCSGCDVFFKEADDVITFDVKYVTGTIQREYWHVDCVPDEWDNEIYAKVTEVVQLKGKDFPYSGKATEGGTGEAGTKYDAILDVLRGAEQPLSCKEIADAQNKYKISQVYTAMTYLAKLSAVVRHGSEHHYTYTAKE